MQTPPRVEAILLGAAQDGGIPQAGCECPACTDAYAHPDQRPLVACLGIIDRRQGACWMVDATPDFPDQLHLLRLAAPGCRLAGIFITHAHTGHYTGLMHLGREAWNARQMPVFGAPRLGDFLAANAPWSQLISLGNIAFQPLQPGAPLSLGEGLNITPIPVPHRAEFSDTVGYAIQGPGRRLFYCPDIDRWEAGGPPLGAELRRSQAALLDGTFFSGDELPGRSMAEVPHPPVQQAVEQLRGLGAEIAFIHFNHTNPLLQPGPQRAWLETAGFTAGQRGQRWNL